MTDNQISAAFRQMTTDLVTELCNRIAASGSNGISPYELHTGDDKICGRSYAVGKLSSLVRAGQLTLENRRYYPVEGATADTMAKALMDPSQDTD